MVAFNRFFTVLAITSMAVATPMTMNKRADSPSAGDIASLVKDITDLVTSIVSIASDISKLSSGGGSDATSPALAIQAQKLEQAFQKASSELDSTAHISSDDASNPDVLAVKADFSNLLVGTISNISTIVQTPGITQAEGTMLLAAIPSIAKTIDSFSSAVPGTTPQNLLTSVDQTLAANGKEQTTGFGSVTSIVQGISKKI